MNFDKITTLSLFGKYNQEYSHCHSVIFSMRVSSCPDIAAALPSALPDECSEIHWRNTVSTVNFFFFGFFLEWRNHCILELLLERCKWFKHDKELSSSHLRCNADFHFFFFTFQVFDSNVFTLCLRKICEKGFLALSRQKKKKKNHQKACASFKVHRRLFNHPNYVSVFFFCSSSKTMNLCSKCFAGEFLFFCMWVLLTYRVPSL